MSQGATDGGATMPWMDGMSQGATDGGATMPWMDGMSQGATDGGAMELPKYCKEAVNGYM